MKMSFFKIKLYQFSHIRTHKLFLSLKISNIFIWKKNKKLRDRERGRRFKLYNTSISLIFPLILFFICICIKQEK
jgi:hypothetical protein